MCTVWYMTRPISHISPRRLAAIASVAAALLAPAAAHADQSAPTVEVDVADQAITIAGAQRLHPGAIRLHLSGDALSEPRTVAVVELERGVTARAARDELDDLTKIGRLVAGANLSAGHDYATTFTARARRHLIVDVTAENGGEARFSVAGKPSGARLPESDAAIVIGDDGFDVPAALPADGVLRIANEGALPHQLTAFRLPASVSVEKARRIVRSGARLDRLGTATVLSGLVSPDAVNRVESRLRRGRYLVVSLYAPLVENGRPDVLRGLVAATRIR